MSQSVDCYNLRTDQRLNILPPCPGSLPTSKRPLRYGLGLDVRSRGGSHGVEGDGVEVCRRPPLDAL